MTVAATVVVFDVNGALSDMALMAARFGEVGAPEYLAQEWFAGLLRDGFALAAAGSSAPFAAVAEGVLADLLKRAPLRLDLEAAVAHVMGGLSELGVHPDVVGAVESLHRQRLRLVTLTNGSVEAADRLLAKAGIRAYFEQVLSVETPGVWKPAPRAYEYASGVCGVGTRELLLVAVHPWDIHGAAGAGLPTVWLNRSGAAYPPYFAEPTHTVGSLGELAESIRNWA